MEDQPQDVSQRPTGDPAVEDLPGDVARFQVTVNNTLPVIFIKCVVNLDGVFKRLFEWRSALLQPLLERLPIHVLHDAILNPVLCANIEERADVRVIQAADGFGFALEAFAQISSVGQMFGKDLDRNHAVQAGIGAPIHLPIPPAPDSSRISKGPGLVPAASGIGCELC